MSGRFPFHCSIQLLSVYTIPAAAVISGHNTDLNTGSKLSLHSFMLLKRERKIRKNHDKVSKKRGKLQRCMICHSSTVINIIRCHQTAVDRVTAPSQVSFYRIKFQGVVLLHLFIRKRVSDAHCQELRFQTQDRIMEDI